MSRLAELVHSNPDHEKIQMRTKEVKCNPIQLISITANTPGADEVDCSALMTQFPLVDNTSAAENEAVCNSREFQPSFSFLSIDRSLCLIGNYSFCIYLLFCNYWSQVTMRVIER